MAPKLSIIIPAYNVEGYIEACLDSILGQTFEDFEVIIIDDGSGDGTGVICDGYAKRDGRITVCHRENGGVSSARNAGIDMAKGEYIIFFDADDFAEPYTFAELYEAASEERADTVLYGYHRYRDGAVIETCPPIFEEGMYGREAVQTELLPRFVGISYDGIDRWMSGDGKGLYVENPALWRALVSRSVILGNELRFDENLKVGEDTVFITEYLSCAERCLVTSKCYYYLVIRESSTISQYEKNAFAKLEGKEKLLAARVELTRRIKERCGLGIREYWLGTVTLSCVELSLLLSHRNSAHGFRQRYRAFLRYAKSEDVRRIVKGFVPKKKASVKAIPFFLLRWGLYLPLFLCTAILGAMHYEFVRG